MCAITLFSVRIRPRIGIIINTRFCAVNSGTVHRHESRDSVLKDAKSGHTETFVRYCIYSWVNFCFEKRESTTIMRLRACSGAVQGEVRSIRGHENPLRVLHPRIAHGPHQHREKQQERHQVRLNHQRRNLSPTVQLNRRRRHSNPEKTPTSSPSNRTPALPKNPRHQ